MYSGLDTLDRLEAFCARTSPLGQLLIDPEQCHRTMVKICGEPLLHDLPYFAKAHGIVRLLPQLVEAMSAVASTALCMPEGGTLHDLFAGELRGADVPPLRESQRDKLRQLLRTAEYLQEWDAIAIMRLGLGLACDLRQALCLGDEFVRCMGVQLVLACRPLEVIDIFKRALARGFTISRIVFERAGFEAILPDDKHIHPDGIERARQELLQKIDDSDLLPPALMSWRFACSELVDAIGASEAEAINAQLVEELRSTLAVEKAMFWCCDNPEAAKVPSGRHDRTTPQSLPPVRVVLFGPDEEPIVLGVRQPKLGKAQYAVVCALGRRGSAGLSKDELARESRRGDAVNVLKRLGESHPAYWGKVIKLPGARDQGGYKIEGVEFAKTPCRG